MFFLYVLYALYGLKKSFFVLLICPICLIWFKKSFMSFLYVLYALYGLNNLFLFFLFGHKVKNVKYFLF